MYADEWQTREQRAVVKSQGSPSWERGVPVEFVTAAAVRKLRGCWQRHVARLGAMQRIAEVQWRQPEWAQRCAR